MEASFDDWLQPFEDSSMANHDNWLITDQEEEGAAAMRKSGGGMMSAAALVHAFGGGDIKLEDRYDEDEEIATGNQGDLERFFKHGSTGLDTLLTKVEVKEELSDVDAFSFRWDDDEELKLNGGSDTEDHTPSLHLDPEDQLLLSSGILSFDDITLHSTSTSLSSTSPSLSLSAFASVSLSSSMPSPMLSADNKGSSPSSPAPSSSPLPSSPSSILPVAPAPSFQLQQQPQMQQQYAVNYAHCSSMPQYAVSHAGNTPSDRAASAVCAPPPPVAPTPAVQSAPTTTPRAPRPRRDSISGTKASAAAKKAGVSSTPPRPRRRRAASTTVARDKQERMEKELAGDDKAKAILSGPLTLEKLASLSTLKVSVLQKQLKMLNASTKGSKAQLIQRLVRYMYLFSQQHRHQLHSQCPSTSGVQHSAAANAGSRCNGLFVDPTLINADSLRAKTAMERGRSSSIGDGTPVLSSSAPSLSIASYLSTHVFPTPLQITLTGRIVEEEEEEEFSD